MSLLDKLLERGYDVHISKTKSTNIYRVVITEVKTGNIAEYNDGITLQEALEPCVEVLCKEE